MTDTKGPSHKLLAIGAEADAKAMIRDIERGVPAMIRVGPLRRWVGRPWKKGS